jgi:predicted RND superfamily exporter protein
MNGRRLLLLIFTVLAVVGVFRVRVDVDILNLLPVDSSVARGLAEYQEKFLQAGELIVVVRSLEPETTLNAVTSVLSEVRRHTNLVDRVFWQPPANESLGDAAQFLAYLWLNSPTNAVLELQHSLSVTNLATVLADSRERIATSFNPSDLFMRPRDPLNLSSAGSAAGETFETPDKFFSSPDGRTRLVYVYAAVPLENYEKCHAWVKEIRSLIARALPESSRSTEVLLTGRPVFVDEISSGMQSDMNAVGHEHRGAGNADPDRHFVLSPAPRMGFTFSAPGHFVRGHDLGGSRGFRDSRATQCH